jgi:hypothetical protein
MNNIDTIISGLSDDDLKAAVRELKAFDETDAPAEGVFRRVVEALMANGTSDSNAVGFTRYALLRAAAYRWADVKDKA